MSLNTFCKNAHLKYVIKGHKSFKIPLNTSLALLGKYPKIKITQKGLVKKFPFKAHFDPWAMLEN